MVLFRKKGTDAKGSADFRDAFLERVLRTGDELMMIVGPEDGSCVCGDWVGAVVSVTGKDSQWPSLIDALDDGVFHEGCRHRLDAYATENHVEAEFCTKIAVAAMEKRRNSGALVARETDSPIGENPQNEFARLYDAAQSADASGATDTALAKCEAALAMLHEQDIFGEEQPQLEHVLEARIRTILRQQRASSE